MPEDRPKTVSRPLWWLNAIALGCVGLAVYWIFFRGEGERPAKRPISESSSEWLDLLGCTDTRSLDGKRQLSLSEDKSAKLIETTWTEGKASQRTAKGNWSYDPTVKRYVVIINGATTGYLLANDGRLQGCMLVKGTLGDANLLESWFASMDDNDDSSADNGRDDYRARD
jgi:hypothetical protein